MSDISSIPNPSQALDALTGASKAPAEERVKQKALGQADFFKLLTTQLASQDPLEPMDDTAFIAQMASFSELEMTSNLTKSIEKFTNDQNFQSAQGMIGKHVSLLVNGEYIEGMAQGIDKSDGTTRVYVDGKGYDVNSVYRVADPNQVADSAETGRSSSGNLPAPEAGEATPQTVPERAPQVAGPAYQLDAKTIKQALGIPLAY